MKMKSKFFAKESKIWPVVAGLVALTILGGCGKEEPAAEIYGEDYSQYVDLCEYKGVEATKIVFDVTDDEIDENLDYKVYDYITYEPVTGRTAQNGDYVNVSFTVKMDGEVLQDLSVEGEDYVLGDGYMFPELEEVLAGMNAGESKTVDVVLTDDYVEEALVGETVQVDLKLNEISIERTPELNEEFVKETLGYKSMEDCRNSIKQELMESKGNDYKYTTVEEIFGYVIQNSEFKGYPEGLYEACEQNYLDSMEFYSAMFGMSVEEYRDLMGLDDEGLKEEITNSANLEIVIGAIAVKEKIGCSEKDIDEYIEKLCLEYGYESKEAFLEDYSTEEIKTQVIYEKVVQFLYDHAKYIEVNENDYWDSGEDEYYEDDEEYDPSELEVEFEPVGAKAGGDSNGN